MAKRFFTTELFDDEWFFELSQDQKVFWIYYLTKCDHAGLLKNNKKLIEFQCGFKDLDTVMEAFANRIIRVSNTLFFCPKFITFQYPGFAETTFKAAISAKEILLKNGIDPENYDRVMEELPNSPIKSNIKGLGNSEDNGNGSGNIKRPEKLKKESDFPEYQECLNLYFEFFEKITGVKPMFKSKDGKALKELIVHFRPMAKEGFTVSDGFRYIFSNWNKLDSYTQNQTDISKISYNLNSIITQFKTKKKNGATNTSNTNYTSPDFLDGISDEIETAYRNREKN